MPIFSGNQSNKGTGYYVNIEGYYDKIHRTTWARRTAGMLSGATLGAIYGAIVGVAAAFVPYVLSVAGIAATTVSFGAAAAAVLPSVGLFAAIAATIGMAINSDVAANAASSAVGLEEKERREKLEQQIIGKSPGPDLPPEQEPAHKITLSEKEPPFFSWKTAAVTVPLFAAFGALIALHPYTASLVFNHVPFDSLIPEAAKVAGKMVINPATVTASAAVFGMFGSFLGLKNSLFSNQLTNFYFKVLTGQLFDKEPQQAVAAQVQPQVTAEKSVERTIEPAIDEPPRPAKSFAASEKVRFSLQGLIEKSEKPNPEQEIVMTR